MILQQTPRSFNSKVMYALFAFPGCEPKEFRNFTGFKTLYCAIRALSTYLYKKPISTFNRYINPY